MTGICVTSDEVIIQDFKDGKTATWIAKNRHTSFKRLKILREKAGIKPYNRKPVSDKELKRIFKKHYGNVYYIKNHYPVGAQRLRALKEEKMK